MISTGAINTLISGATQGLSTTTQLNAVTQSVSDLQDIHLPENYVAKPDDWGLVDDLQDYVEGKVGTGIVREPTDWASYPGDPNLKKYTEGKVGDFINGAGFSGSSYMIIDYNSEQAVGPAWYSLVCVTKKPGEISATLYLSGIPSPWRSARRVPCD
jgi:hypothetical protein